MRVLLNETKIMKKIMLCRLLVLKKAGRLPCRRKKRKWERSERLELTIKEVFRNITILRNLLTRKGTSFSIKDQGFRSYLLRKQTYGSCGFLKIRPWIEWRAWQPNGYNTYIKR